MSTIQLTPARRSRLADVLYGQLLMRIVHGDVAEGDRLPSEAEIGRCSAPRARSSGRR
jgi:DNA-binding FadR family transcriptional regulator